MNCPICNKPMKRLREDVSSDSKTKKEYDRTMLHCKNDDAWATIEIPKAKPARMRKSSGKKAE